MPSLTPGKLICAGAVLLFCFSATAQQAGSSLFAAPNGDSVATQPQMTLNPEDGAPAPDDPTLTTHETAVECAMALIVQSASDRHVQLADPAGNSFKAGLCTGKIQSYMLRARAENPDCFPKYGLDDAMRLFVKWVEAHPQEGTLLYPEGFKQAFEDAVPCLKK